ncbi:sodium-dependent transporter [candidate division KSB1 bacterium]|nr:sodium-dependent transporter [bacterium]RKY77157.1 MAG: sodium-dependent transporter [candidate division KSB1 bacterium]RKY82064.1 MAG: sodium-dependent transporter [candidate division KSB1 bacterium]
MEKSREQWHSKLGFVLAAAGSAIGLGNIWRFPYMTGQNGGAAFVLIYMIFVVLIGFTIMLAELTLGRHTQRNPVGAFAKIFPGTQWKWVGALGVVTGVAILSFYSVIAGWTMGYIFKIATGQFNNITDSRQVEEIFSQFVQNPLAAVGLLALFIGLTVGVIVGGVSAGIERWTKILMPILLGILLLLLVRSLTLGKGVVEGLLFYLKPNFHAVKIETWVQALGQALFSLSLGMGAMITYGSYISKKENLATCAAYVCIFDTLIALLAGLAIFPALFAMGMDPAGGPGLVFLVLPVVFDMMPGGTIFGTAFFILLTIAALTSTISLLEVAVAYFIDERNWSRKTAAVVVGVLAFLLGIPSALSQGASTWFGCIPLVHMPFLDFMNVLFGNYALTLGTLLIALFVGWKWGTKNAVKEILQGNSQFKFQSIWMITIRFVAPAAIIIILIYLICTGKFF